MISLHFSFYSLQTHSFTSPVSPSKFMASFPPNFYCMHTCIYVVCMYIFQNVAFQSIQCHLHVYLLSRSFVTEQPMGVTFPGEDTSPPPSFPRWPAIFCIMLKPCLQLFPVQLLLSDVNESLEQLRYPGFCRMTSSECILLYLLSWYFLMWHLLALCWYQPRFQKEVGRVTKMSWESLSRYKNITVF